jgi:hypothetical protein
MFVLPVEWARADALGNPDAQGRLGYALSLGLVTVDDPDGPTERAATLQPLNLVYSYTWREPYRLWMEGFYHAATVDPSVNDIGQDITRLGGRVLAHTRLDIRGWARVWAGGGLTVARERFTVRQQVDADGFGTRFSDRSEFGTGITLDGVSEWRLNKNWDSAVHLLYNTPIGHGVEEFSLSMTFFYTR